MLGNVKMEKTFENILRSKIAKIKRYSNIIEKAKMIMNGIRKYIYSSAHNSCANLIFLKYEILFREHSDEIQFRSN